MKNQGTLCFLHGWGIGRHVWSGFARGFAPAWNVKLLALPGYDGRASHVTGREGVASSLLAEVPDASFLVGWSLGGLIGITIAAMKPVRKLILLASTPCFVNKENWSCGIETRLLENLQQRMQHDAERAVREFTLLSSRGDRNPRATFRRLSSLNGKNNVHNGALHDGLDMLMRSDLRAEFAGLHCDAAVMLAANDQLLPVSAGAQLQSLRPGLDLQIIGEAGHAPFISRPEETRRILSAMLEKSVVR